MTWSTVFSDVIQPILFGGLFTMTFIGMIIAIRTEKRVIKNNKDEILKNADKILKDHNMLVQLKKEQKEDSKRLDNLFDQHDLERQEADSTDLEEK